MRKCWPEKGLLSWVMSHKTKHFSRTYRHINLERHYVGTNAGKEKVKATARCLHKMLLELAQSDRGSQCMQNGVTWPCVTREITHGLCTTVNGHAKAQAIQTCTNGVLPNHTLLWLWPVTDHEPRSRHVPANKIWRRTESTPQSRRWRSHAEEIISNHSSREMTIIWVRYFDAYITFKLTT